MSSTINGQGLSHRKYKKKLLRKRQFRDNFELLLLTIPAFLLVLVFAYLPMGGMIIAFKKFRFDQTIWDMAWAGFDNFKFFFTSQDALRVTLNTVGYASAFLLINVFVRVTTALFMFELKSRSAIKVYQTVMLIPHFISWVLVSFVVYIVLNPKFGLISGMLQSMDLPIISWYSEPKYWPVILTYLNTWKGLGMGAIIYYSGLMSIDIGLFDAAKIDGASRFQQTRYISIPSLYPLMTILILLGIADLFRGDFGLFYQIPKNSGMLFKTTNVIDTYIFRALMEAGNVGMSAAVSFFQSFAAFFLILFSNFLVKKFNPDNAIF